MVDAAEVPEAFVAAVRERLPRLTALIAIGPAAELGRLGAPEDSGAREDAGARGAVGGQARARFAERLGRSAAEPVALAALRRLGPLPAERLLGALELTAAALELPPLPPAAGHPESTGAISLVSAGQDSTALTAATLLERLSPGIADAALTLTRHLATAIPPADAEQKPPDADPDAEQKPTEPCPEPDEQALAAAHGSHWLALALAASAAVTSRAEPPAVVDRPAAIAGLAVGAAAAALRDAPMPFRYDGARLARLRHEYLLPRHGYGTVTVTDPWFALTEAAFPTTPDFGGNGLVTAHDGYAAIRTGATGGPVRVHLSVLAGPPPGVEPDWEEVVEVSWHAGTGRASVLGPDGPGDPQLRHATPPWPGDYRLRVHARGRDDAGDPDAGDTEMYRLLVWAAPAAPPVVHRSTDRLGFRLRGEPEPVRPRRPEHAYRWIRRTDIGLAATVTVVTAGTTAEVLRAFGADPDRPEPVAAIEADLAARGAIDPWVAVHDAGDAIVAVEVNGYQGSHAAVLRAAAAHGRVASMHWNERALTRLSFADGGVLLAAFEPWENVTAEPRVAAALTGLDFTEPGLRPEKGLVAVERFTGCGLTPSILEQLRTGTGHRIT
ncbi:DUF6461 domain-containing protein [Actinoplanes awajinensis]|uniref:Uncharacterized protein n=1 Tax=Actinoplanes awajinensis subsp. mycoplanecinus TaxID=135947 RepID=A0A101JM11_9ACTN|nr:DUF6461 domain-containing protein [Actinoplanes awajinensis]KUL28851.1 hypothetical protein ADL15_30600 [Actinoplanes awajinensis subsp. mycoplanecinus]